MSQRRFPRPWTADETEACFIVRDQNGQAHAKCVARLIAVRSIGRGLARVEPEAGSLVVYSAKHGEIALDGDGINSPFASALIKNLATPGLEVRRRFDVVRDDNGEH
jgi:uncharacterized caspase-like protein